MLFCVFDACGLKQTNQAVVSQAFNEKDEECYHFLVFRKYSIFGGKWLWRLLQV